MSEPERDALRAAVVASPDDDLPRLVFADYLEERGEPARAAFIRDQIELANTPPWEPFAVHARRRVPPLEDDATYELFLPGLGKSLVWGEPAMRRGFGYSLKVGFVPALTEIGERLLGVEPVAHLELAAAPLAEYWRDLFAQPWFARIHKLTLPSMANSNELLRELEVGAGATGIRELDFRFCDRPSAEFLVQRLSASPIAAQLRSLTFSFGPLDLLESLRDFPTPLESLSCHLMRSSGGAVEDFVRLPCLSRLKRLDLSCDALEPAVIRAFVCHGLPRELYELNLSGCNLRAEDVALLAAAPGLGELRRLNLDYDHVGDGLAALMSALPRVRSLSLSGTKLANDGIASLTRAAAWPNLVELNLSQNWLGDVAADSLCDAPMPPDLTTLNVGGNEFSTVAKRKLAAHFGDRVVGG